MSRILALLLVAGVLLSISCKKDTHSIKIGISKIITHPALDAVEKGIVDQLTADGYTNVIYDFQNANGESATANQIANKFKDDKDDVVIGIATPTSQSLVNVFSDTNVPVVFSAVTDPVSAGLVTSTEVGDKLSTGVSDMTPVKEQIEMFLKIKPIKKLGTIYCTNESNSVTITGMLKNICKEKGIEVIESTVTNSSEVKQATESIIDRVDGIYINTDNTVVAALTAVVDVANSKKVPVFSADPSSAELIGVIGAYGFNYYQVGIKTGKIVSRILKGEKTTDIPTEFMREPTALDLLINLDAAKLLGLNISEEIKNSANKLVIDRKILTK